MVGNKVVSAVRGPLSWRIALCILSRYLCFRYLGFAFLMFYTFLFENWRNLLFTRAPSSLRSWFWPRHILRVCLSLSLLLFSFDLLAYLSDLFTFWLFKVYFDDSAVLHWFHSFKLILLQIYHFWLVWDLLRVKLVCKWVNLSTSGRWLSS